MRCLGNRTSHFEFSTLCCIFLLRSYMLKRKDNFTPSVNFLFLEAAVCKVRE